MKYIVCFSGGHSSALVAVEEVRKAGNTIEEKEENGKIIKMI